MDTFSYSYLPISFDSAKSSSAPSSVSSKSPSQSHSFYSPAASPPFDLEFSAVSDYNSSDHNSPATSYLATPGGSPTPLPLDLNGQQSYGQHKGHHYNQSQDLEGLFPLPGQQHQRVQYAEYPIASHSADGQFVYSLSPSLPAPSLPAGTTLPSPSSILSPPVEAQPSSAQPQYTVFAAGASAPVSAGYPGPLAAGPHHQHHTAAVQAQGGQGLQHLHQQQHVYYSQPAPVHLHHQQQQQYYYTAAPAPPAPIAAPIPVLPSFETPQGTYYFVPNGALAASAAPVAPQAPVSVPTPPAGASWDATQQAQYSQMSQMLMAAGLPAMVGGDIKPLKPMPGGKQGKKSTRKNAGKGQVKRFICPHPDCGRAFARNFNMQSHLKSHLGIRDFDCPHCPKKFSRRHDRARHCSAVHDAHNVDDASPEGEGDDDDEDEDDVKDLNTESSTSAQQFVGESSFVPMVEQQQYYLAPQGSVGGYVAG